MRRVTHRAGYGHRHSPSVIMCSLRTAVARCAGWHGGTKASPLLTRMPSQPAAAGQYGRLAKTIHTDTTLHPPPPRLPRGTGRIQSPASRGPKTLQTLGELMCSSRTRLRQGPGNRSLTHEKRAFRVYVSAKNTWEKLFPFLDPHPNREGPLP